MAGIRKKPTAGGLWQAWYTDYTGKKRFFTMDSKRDAHQKAHVLEDEHRQIRDGLRPLPDAMERHKKRPFEEVVREYIAWGEAQGGRGGRPWGATHARMRKAHLAWWQERLGLLSLKDVHGTLPRVEKALRELQRRGRAGKTIMNYQEALAALCDWCKQRGYLDADPLEGLAPFDTTPKTIRRAMTPDEIAKLLKACAPHRRLLYQTALLSGLRRNELRNLSIEHLDQQDRGLHLDPAWTKNRKPGFQSLPGWLVEELDAFAQSDGPNPLYARFFNRAGTDRGDIPKHPLLYVPSHTARALDADLKAAGIPKHGPGGKIDFHASRTAYINLVLESQGITPKEAQELARHGTLELTMNVYGRVRQGRLAQIVEDVGEFLRPKAAEVVPGLYRQAVGAEQESATPLNNRELHSFKMVEAAGIEPASEIKSTKTSTCVVDL